VQIQGIASPFVVGAVTAALTWLTWHLPTPNPSPLCRAAVTFGIWGFVGHCCWTVSVSTNEERRRRWWREGRCHRCGYDLRVTRRRCPECGSVVLWSINQVNEALMREREQRLDRLRHPIDWPREVWLAIWFVVPFVLTLCVCWRVNTT
jgi:hypothetical protein